MCRSSVHSNELFGRLHRVSAEIIVPGVGNTHEALGRPDQTIEPLAERHGNNGVVLAVYHQHRCRDLAEVRPSVPLAARLRCVQACGSLFRKLFLPRCSPHLSHRDEPGRSPLNAVCYSLK